MPDQLDIRRHLQSFKVLQSLSADEAELVRLEWKQRRGGPIPYRVAESIFWVVVLCTFVGEDAFFTSTMTAILLFVVMAVGMSGFFAVHVVVYGDFVRQRLAEWGYCTRCGYDLTGVASAKCPECGESLRGSAVSAIVGVQRRPWPVQAASAARMRIERDIARRIRWTSCYWIALIFSVAITFFLWATIAWAAFHLDSSRTIVSPRVRVVVSKATLLLQLLAALLGLALFRRVIEPVRRRIRRAVCSEHGICGECFAELSGCTTTCSVCNV